MLPCPKSPLLFWTNYFNWPHLVSRWRVIFSETLIKIFIKLCYRSASWPVRLSLAACPVYIKLNISDNIMQRGTTENFHHSVPFSFFLFSYVSPKAIFWRIVTPFDISTKMLCKDYIGCKRIQHLTSEKEDNPWVGHADFLRSGPPLWSTTGWKSRQISCYRR